MAVDRQRLYVAVGVDDASLKRLMIDTANKRYAHHLSQDPAWRDYETVVDRRKGAHIESVRPGGIIRMIKADVGAIVEFIWEQLRKRSPVLSGNYQDSHIVMINGQGVTDISKWKPGDRIQFVNTTPYARKIEGYMGHLNPGGQPLPQSMKAPNGVYRMVYAVARRRWGNVARIDYTLVPLNLGFEVWGFEGGARSRHRAATSRKRIARVQVYPCITLDMNPR